MNKNTGLLVVGMIIALAIAASAPFLASSNPDGLESAAGEMDEAENREADYYESPMPDYVFPGQEDEGFAGVIAIVLGTILIFLFVMTFYAFTSTNKRKSRATTEEGETDVCHEDN